MDTSLAYTPERGAELAENVKEVVKEIEAAKPAGSNVSGRGAHGGKGGRMEGRGRQDGLD